MVGTTTLTRAPIRATTVFAWASLACLCLLAARIAVTGSWRLGFLPWNLFLAWVPYVLGQWIRRQADRTRHGTGILVLPTAVWLLFFPNAPYIVTDIIHLRRSPPGHHLVEALTIGAFAAVGVALAVVSLHTMHEIVKERLGRRTGWAFVAAVAGLTGLGVWIGRFLRWNSWDVFTNPRGCLVSIFDALLDPGPHVGPLGFSAAFAFGLIAVYFVWHRTAERSEIR